MFNSNLKGIISVGGEKLLRFNKNKKALSWGQKGHIEQNIANAHFFFKALNNTTTF